MATKLYRQSSKHWLSELTYVVNMGVLEGLFAQFALDCDWLVMAFLLVDGLVLGQICLLSERLVTSCLFADEGSFTRMHTQMVEKVMPLSEEHSTVGVITLKNFDLSHCAGVLVSDNSELSSVGHCLIDLDWVHVEAGALLDVDFGVLGHCLRDLVIRQLIALYNHRCVIVRWVFDFFWRF